MFSKTLFMTQQKSHIFPNIKALLRVVYLLNSQNIIFWNEHSLQIAQLIFKAQWYN